MSLRNQYMILSSLVVEISSEMCTCWNTSYTHQWKFQQPMTIKSCTDFLKTLLIDNEIVSCIENRPTLKTLFLEGAQICQFARGWMNWHKWLPWAILLTTRDLYNDSTLLISSVKCYHGGQKFTLLHHYLRYCHNLRTIVFSIPSAITWT